MKNIISFILQRSKGLICNYSSKLGIILWGLLIISAIFIPEGDYFNLVLDVLKLGVSFLVFHFIFNKFTYSNNIIVRLMQKIVVYFICVNICLYLFSFVDILDTIHCDSDSDPDIDRIPSPDPNIINSPLEDGDNITPLNELVDVIFSYNMLELYLILFIIYILFYRNILNIIIKYFTTKFNYKIKIVGSFPPEGRRKGCGGGGINMNKKVMNVLLIILFFLLIIFKLVNIIFSYDLHINLNEYIIVYNEIKKSSILILLSCNNIFKYSSKIYLPPAAVKEGGSGVKLSQKKINKMGPTGLVNKYIKYLNISSILLLINNIKFLFYLKNNKTYSYLPLILLNFFGAPPLKGGSGVPKDIEPFFDLTLSILILLLIVLFCFVRIVSYFYTVYLIDKYNLYEKYPKYQKFIKRFEKMRSYYVIAEIILCITILIFIILLCLFVLYITIT